jgi:PAS domain S-box-containing protein
MLVVSTLFLSAPGLAIEPMSSSGGPPHKRILMIYPDSSIGVGSLTVGRAVERKLLSRTHTPVQLYAEFLDRARFPSAYQRELFVRYLREKYSDTEFDFVLAIDADPLALLLSNKERIAKKAPLGYVMLAPAGESRDPAPNAVGVVSEVDLSATVGLARRLQPDARNLVVIAGAADYDRMWAQIAADQLRHHAQQLHTRYLVGLTHEAVVRELGALSRDTIVLLLSFYKDGSGREHYANFVDELTAASAAPVYSPYSSSLGRGIVGGHMDSFEAMGDQTADLIDRVFSGEDPAAIPPQLSRGRAYRVDARQLQRWNLPEGELPADAIVMFKVPTLWVGHRGAVIMTMSVLMLLSGLVGLLLSEVIRRRRVETELSDSKIQMEFAAASADIGLWRFDLRTHRLWSSDHCREILGLPEDAPLTAQALADSTHPDDRHLAKASIRAATFGALAGETTEFRIVKPDGDTRWILARGRTELDENGRPVRVSGIFRDVTGYRVAQQEAKRLSQEMLNAQDHERERIAQDLHDSTAQHLTAIGLNLIALRGARQPNDMTSKAMEDMRLSLDEASKELRAFTYLLFPPALAADGLMATLSRYVTGFERRTGVRVNIRDNLHGDELTIPLQAALLRIAQEALANVHRHANASFCSIHLRPIQNRLHLVIADNGKGFPENCGRGEGQLPAGVGVAGMRARLRPFGGEILVRRKGEWTVVHGVVPIDKSSFASAPRTARVASYVSRAGMRAQS